MKVFTNYTTKVAHTERWHNKKQHFDRATAIF